MPSLDQAHNHNGLESQTHQQLPGFHPAVTSDGITTIPPLPAYTYTQPSAKRPKVFTAFDQSIPSVRSNGASRSNSPDPHEFYRPHQDKYRASLAGSSGQGDIRVEQREIGMVELGQRPNPAIARPYPPKLPQSTSRIQSRYTKSPTSDRSPLNSTRSTPALFNTARNRQTSLKDLVNKFNQPQDEALPLPRESSSRSPSANSNPGGSSNNAHGKPRKSSLSTSTGDVSGKKISATSLHSMGTSGPYPRRGRTNEDSNASPRSKRTLRTHRTEPIDSRQDASKSATDLGQHADTLPRRPLFGEILATSPAHTNPGFGIPGPRRRRGSEGSMHSPNPMFPQDRGRPIPEISPSSPSAWYLGMTPTLEEIKMERNIPDLPSNLHRRTRSDFSGAPSKPPTSKMYGTNLSPSRDPQSSSSSTTTSKRNSQSRIPVSTTRRLSTASDSGNSTQSTRAGSALGRAHIISPTRPAATIPKHLQKPRSPPRHSRSSTPQRSPRRGDFSSGTGRPTTSPLLTAYISAPMPKKSPPLRSSRPRQPVSNASTSASRARAVERFSGHEDGSSRNTREARPRKPPELAGVDFAARRQKIQQAVTKTVKEEERKDEQRRASMAFSMTREGHMSDGYPTAEESDTTGSQGGARAIEVNMGRSTTQETEDDYKTPVEEDTEPEMAINIGHLSERSVLDMSMEDSPTLGTFHRFSVSLDQGQKGGESIPSDAEPSSAITAGTSDSVDTFFDDEPQDDSHDSSRHLDEQKTLLNQIITTRDPSSSPDGVRQPLAAEESVSERDDRESIQIMLGETPILENAPFKEQQYEGKSKEPQLNEDPESRWSMSSWTSSNKSREDREAPLARIDEYSPSYSAEQPHLSISTSASQQTSQLWSPQSFTSPRTARTTMDSDAYSTINRVLDHYHDPSIVSPELIQDVQQHIITQSPDLARQGGWDLKKVTALYLQERAKGSYRQPKSVPDPVRFQIRQRTSSVKIPEVSEKEVREDHDEKMLESMEREDGDPTPPGTNLSVDQGEFKPARASLTGPDDWDMSPSLGGLHLQAEAGDSPSEDKPILPPKDWQTAKKDIAEMAEEALGRKPPAHSHPQLPPIEGLAINIMPPQMEDSPTIPPPLPFHTLPPPPFDASNPIRIRSPPSPSVYGKQVPPKVLKALTADAISPPLPDLPTNDSLHQSRSATSLIQQPSSSASMSQERTSVDHPSTSTDAPSKNSSPSPDQKRLTRRRHIIKELVDTEHSFGQDMKVVDDIYKGTANIIVISPEDVKTLFGNSDHIVAFSTNFLDALKQGSKSVYVLARSKRWRSNRVSNATSYSGNTDDQSSLNGVELSDDEKDRKTFIGEQFQHYMESMEKVYTEYLKNHDLANQKLLALQKDLKVGIWLKECRAYAHDLTSAWNLDSLLVKPVQRILKYPLLLDQLLEVTPENHPDFKALDIAAREMKSMAKRIDGMKKRTDVMGQVINTRKRKESDVRGGLSKAFGRRTAEKLRQQVGLSDPVDDKAYSAICEKFGSHFFKLQIVMRDVERYTNDVQVFMNNFCDFASSMEAHIDVGQTNYPELESKWRKFRMSTREMSMTALTDHVSFSQHRRETNRKLKLNDTGGCCAQERH